jgi:hypothetical protein
MLSPMTYRYLPHMYSESCSAAGRNSYAGEVEKMFADQMTAVEEGLHWGALIGLALALVQPEDRGQFRTRNRYLAGGFP